MRDMKKKRKDAELKNNKKMKESSNGQEINWTERKVGDNIMNK